MSAQSPQLRRCIVQSIRSYPQLQRRRVIYGRFPFRCTRREPTGVRLLRRRGLDEGSGRGKLRFLRLGSIAPFFSTTPPYYRYPIEQNVRGHGEAWYVSSWPLV